ncbi:hypothetical protein PHISCL_00315 [Aspergillus sclerotialis]|uniref:Cyclin-domain-containing protein n=1 Tax=Aspergillus sclerotialis TaxID=2070753 RepID=A0A3A3ABD5_9EURO|nr:hypothetical protein PHISCL_00315 [Aspergillus sclerotialis]
MMLGGASDPSGYVYRSSSRQTSHPSQLEAGSSRSTSTSTTPTSSTAPPSSSIVGSARLPPHQHHDVPAYLRRQSSQTSSQPSMNSLSTMPASVHSFSETPSMASSTHARPSNYPSNHTVYPSQMSGRTPRHSAESFRPATVATSQSSPGSPRLQPTTRSLRPLGSSEGNSPSRIKVRDLSHIRDFASEELLDQSQRAQGSRQWPQDRQYEISSMPVTDVIEMVAGLLTKITTTNDMHHEDIHRHLPWADGTTNLSPQATSVLAFHAKNAPGITILSYLTRIHKYCPTTYEVFLSLLVYFDRMTEIVNKGQLDRLRRRWDSGSGTAVRSNTAAPSDSSDSHQTRPSPIVTPPSSTGMTAQDPESPSISPSLYPQDNSENLSQFFVVDSFNIHRLAIAGVTCASKFFSDIFYTNSRYAKVGGLPLVELNHLEIQFLILNDFRLFIPVEELEAYGTMLVEFYAREIMAQQQQQQPPPTAPTQIVTPSSAAAPQSEGMYMRPGQGEVRQTPTPP